LPATAQPSDTRLTVIDRVPAEDPAVFAASPGMAGDTATLLGWVTTLVPARSVATLSPAAARAGAPIATRPATARPLNVAPSRSATAIADPTGVELAYEAVDWAPGEGGCITQALYEGYALQSIRIPGAQAHPTRLVQSAAMASVAPPKPTYQPHLPAIVISEGLLSDAQLESIICAGEAHAGYLTGSWTLDETFDVVSAAPDDAENAVRFRRGWFLGDGTGAGKSRQVAGILLDNWLKGRRRAVWVSKSDKLIEDAQRDSSALGQERLLITPLARFRQGTADPLGPRHPFYNLRHAAVRRARGKGFARATDRGLVGSRFRRGHRVRREPRHAERRRRRSPSAASRRRPSRGVRVSVCSMRCPMRESSTSLRQARPTVHNLAYAQRLGLCGGADFPFATRAEFVEAIEVGGVAAMEVLARDLKALGLYAARSLSYEGIEYELIEHQLTPEQVRIYDAYAGAFQVIHNNLNAALQAANITGETGPLNRQAKSAARSAFESAKQRFFNHLITAMKTPGADRRGRALSRSRPCRRHPDRLHRRGSHGAPPRRDPDRGLGRRAGRYHAARIRVMPTSA